MVSIEQITIFLGYKLIHISRKQIASLSFMIFALGLGLGFLTQNSSKMVSVLSFFMCVIILFSSIKALKNPGTTIYTLLFAGTFSFCTSILLCLGSYEIAHLLYEVKIFFLLIQIGLVLLSAAVWNWCSIKKIIKNAERKENKISVVGPLVGVLLALFTSRVVFSNIDENAAGLFVSIYLFLGALISIGGTYNFLKVYLCVSKNIQLPKDSAG